MAIKDLLFKVEVAQRLSFNWRFWVMNDFSRYLSCFENILLFFFESNSLWNRGTSVCSLYLGYSSSYFSPASYTGQKLEFIEAN